MKFIAHIMSKEFLDNLILQENLKSSRREEQTNNILSELEETDDVTGFGRNNRKTYF